MDSQRKQLENIVRVLNENGTMIDRALDLACVELSNNSGRFSCVTPSTARELLEEEALNGKNNG